MMTKHLNCLELISRSQKWKLWGAGAKKKLRESPMYGFTLPKRLNSISMINCLYFVRRMRKKACLITRRPSLNLEVARLETWESPSKTRAKRFKTRTLKS